MAKKIESYETMFNNLDDIVKKMDNGDMTLDESLKSYEAGIKLCNSLYKILKDSEGRIEIIKNDKIEDFKPEEVKD
jgi:exodeoxyribonuclease VII small subunit